MSNHLSYWLPNWAVSVFEKKKCTRCNSSLLKSDIVAVGFRTINEKEITLYVEYFCNKYKCGHRAICYIKHESIKDLEELCYTILSYINKKKALEKSRLLRKPKIEGPITEKEASRFSKFIQASGSHEDFMKEIGVLSSNRINKKNHDTS